MTHSLVPLLNPKVDIPPKEPDLGIDPDLVDPIPDPSPVPFVETLRSNTPTITVGPPGQTQGDLTLTLNVSGGGSSYPKRWIETAAPRSGSLSGVPYDYPGSGYQTIASIPGYGQSAGAYWNPTLTQNWYFHPRWYWDDGDGNPSYNYIYLPRILYSWDSSYAADCWDIPDGYTFNLVYIQQAGIPRETIPTVTYLQADPEYHITAYYSSQTVDPIRIQGWGTGLRELTVFPITVAKSGERGIGEYNPLGVDTLGGPIRYTMYVGPPTVYVNKVSNSFPNVKHNTLPWYFNNEAFV